MRTHNRSTTNARRRTRWGLVLSWMVIVGVTTSRPVVAREPAPPLAFRVAKIVTMDDGDRVINNAIVLVRDGKVEALGRAREIAVPAGYEVVNAPDLWLVPGLVECHNHSVAAGGINDMVYLTNPGLRTMDLIEPESLNLERARAGGVTTSLTIPGSGTNLSGFGTIAKLAGRTPEEQIIAAPGSLKIAQAGNPENYWFRPGRTYQNYNIRQTLEKARDYAHEWRRYETGERADAPEFDPVFEDFRGLFAREYVVSVHTQGYQLMMTTLDMLTDKLGLRVVLDHCTFNGFLTAPLVRERADVYAINGPRQFWFERRQRRLVGHAAAWWAGGVKRLGLNTDAPVIPQEEIVTQAAAACYFGWQPYPALRGMTRVPAEALGVDDRLGSIAVGKDADFGLWTGDPVNPTSSCEYTIISGRIEYRASEGRRF
ncbi:MAG: amidohydrolase family protein [Planctomycetota bacterium]